MNCRRVKDMILTDYSDREIEPDQRELIEKHLAQCKTCRAFASMVRRSAIEPFIKAEPQKPLDSVWHRIKEKIEAETRQEARPYSIPNLKDKLKTFIYIPRPVFTVAIVMVLVIALSVVAKLQVNKQEVASIQSEEQIEYLVNLFGENAYVSNGEDVGYGTAIEEYFL
ncbi:MAG: zf-HC2 domain-containing protein [Candidatus Omnitrophica bacterium]|nr:zf-HC2 domain-containing protein [Candidatus Omnitrophota bacterium]